MPRRVSRKSVTNGVEGRCAGGTMLWPLLVGLPRAEGSLLHGRVLRPKEAIQLHLVSKAGQTTACSTPGIRSGAQLASSCRFFFPTSQPARAEKLGRLPDGTAWDMLGPWSSKNGRAGESKGRRVGRTKKTKEQKKK